MLTDSHLLILEPDFGKGVFPGVVGTTSSDPDSTVITAIRPFTGIWTI